MMRDVSVRAWMSVCACVHACVYTSASAYMCINKCQSDRLFLHADRHTHKISALARKATPCTHGKGNGLGLQARGARSWMLGACENVPTIFPHALTLPPPTHTRKCLCKRRRMPFGRQRSMSTPGRTSGVSKDGRAGQKAIESTCVRARERASELARDRWRVRVYARERDTTMQAGRERETCCKMASFCWNISSSCSSI